MPAETAAAAPGATGANTNADEPITTATPAAPAADKPETTGTPKALDPASHSRVAAILEEEGMSATEIQETVKLEDQPEGTSHAEEKQRSDGADRAQEGAGSRRSDDEGGGRKAEGGKEDEGKAADEEEALTPEQQKTWPPDALKRIHKLTAQRTDERTRAEKAEQIAQQQNALARQLHAQLQNAGRVRPQTTAEDPLAHVLSPQDLQREIELTEELLEWATTNPDGLTEVVIGTDEATGEPIKRDYSAQEMAKIVAKSGRILRQHVPAKAAMLQQEQMHDQYARATLPAMFEDGTDEHNALEQLQQNVPELFTRLPGAKQWVAWALIGRGIVMAAREKAGANGNGNGKAQTEKVYPKVAPFLRKHPPMAPSVPEVRMPPADLTGKARVEKAQERALTTGDENAEVDYISALREQQASKRDVALV